MISDPDILRTAQLLVKRHGADAQMVADQRFRVLFDGGDFDGAGTWMNILKVIEELLKVKPKAEKAN